MPLLLRALLQLLKNWKAIAAFAGLVMSVGFSGKVFVSELAQAVKELWWLAALGCLVMLFREYIRGYFDLKKERVRQERR